MMPLMTRRSSTRGKPRDQGKNGSIRRICARDSNIRSDMNTSDPLRITPFRAA